MKNIVVIVLNNFLFMTIPFGYSFVSVLSGATTSSLYDTLNAYSIAVSLVGAATNMFIYSLKYPKFKETMLHELHLDKLIVVTHVKTHVNTPALTTKF